MHVHVSAQVLRPGVQHQREGADAAEPARVGRELGERGSHTLHQRVVHPACRHGRQQSITVDKPRPIALVRKTLPQVVQLIDELLETCTDGEVAKCLNELGHRNWRGNIFTTKKVTLVRLALVQIAPHRSATLSLLKGAKGREWAS